jgi:hypothetical protein
MTMALLGVMLAICAALVGAARTELVATSIEQANKIGLQQSEATKLRVMATDRELLHALTPSRGEVAKFEAALKDVHSRTGKADDEDTAETKELVDVATRSVADLLTPDKEDEDRIEGLHRTYARDYAEAKQDAEAYDAAIAAHAREAEGYERAQLCAEIGIVIASIALLITSRGLWLVAVLIGLLGLGNGVVTRVTTSRALAAAEHAIEEAKTNAAAIEGEESDESGKGESGESGGKNGHGAPAERTKPAE